MSLAEAETVQFLLEKVQPLLLDKSHAQEGFLGFVEGRADGPQQRAVGRGDGRDLHGQAAIPFSNTCSLCQRRSSRLGRSRFARGTDTSFPCIP